jgi:arsenate reductase
MAEGWARALRPDWKAYSAGTEHSELDPRAVRVMSEVGVDISHQRSKSISQLKDTAFDYVITLCDTARETCPVVPFKVRQLHQGFDDPKKSALMLKKEEDILEVYRRVREEIKTFISALLTEL